MSDVLANIQPGLLTGNDITNAVKKDEIIIAPFFKENVTPVGYNFSFSMFIMSVNTTKFQKIKEDKNGQLFFWLKPNETVLILTLEAIKVPQNIGGTFHSKVSIVSDGLSHVSTTLDPGWRGQLLVPMNNPTNKAKRVIIGTNRKKGAGFDPQFKTFITLVLYKSSTSNTVDSDNQASRLDLLIEKILNDGKKIKDKDLSETVKRGYIY